MHQVECYFKCPIVRRNIKGRPFQVGLIVRINAYRKEHPLWIA